MCQGSAVGLVFNVLEYRSESFVCCESGYFMYHRSTVNCRSGYPMCHRPTFNNGSRSSVCCGSAMDSRSGPSIESGSGEDAWDIMTKMMVTCLQTRLM